MTIIEVSHKLLTVTSEVVVPVMFEHTLDVPIIVSLQAFILI